MTGYYEIAPARSVGPAFQLARFVVVLLAVTGLAFRYEFLAVPDFLHVCAVALALLAAAALFWVHAFLQVWRKGRPGGRRLTEALALLLVAFIPFGYSATQAVRYPELNDVTTDRSDPPVFFAIDAVPRGAGAHRPGPVSPQAARQNEAYPEITGRRYPASPDVVIEEIDKLIDADGWTHVHRSGSPDAGDEVSIEGLVRTTILRFPADIVVRLTDEGDSTYVDMRSASHYGRHDLGDNARHIARFLSDLDAAMLARAGV